MYVIKDKRKFVRYRVSFNTRPDLSIDKINFVVKQFYGTLTQTAIFDTHNRHTVIFKANITALKFLFAAKRRQGNWKLSKIRVKAVEEFQPRKKIVAI